MSTRDDLIAARATPTLTEERIREIRGLATILQFWISAEQEEALALCDLALRTVQAERRAEAAEAQLASQAAIIAEAREALKPFAELSDYVQITGASNVGGRDLGKMLLSARTLLSKLGEAK